MTKLRRFITKADHTSMLYRKGDSDVLTESHLNSGVEKAEYDFGTYLYSDLYKINLSKLISDDNKEVLESAMGPEWEKIMNEHFAKIERKIHDGAVARYTRISVPTTEGFQKRGIKSLFYAFRHKFFEKTDFKATHRKMMGTYYTDAAENDSKVEMLCSGFTAHATIDSFVELNKVLKETYEIDLAEDLVTVPISKSANLDVMTPQVLINELKSFKCLEIVEASPDISKHLRRS